MGSLFKPSSTVVQAPQQSTTTYEIPQYIKDIQERTLGRIETASQVPYQAYTGQRVAPFSAQEQQAQNIVQQQILPQAGQLAQIGAQTYTPQIAQQYMNPYQEQVIQGTIKDIGQQYAQSQRALNAQAIGAGAFGGDRLGVERALGTERFLKQVGDVSGQLRQAGFESGANRFAADRAAQLGAAQAQLGALGTAATGLSTLGQTQRGISQADLTELYRDFIEQRGYDIGQAQQVIGALAGAPIRSYGEERSGMVGQVLGSPSPFGQITGALQAGAALYSLSDIRLKEDINLIGKSPNGINIYSFKYKFSPQKYQGVMAHQVPYAASVDENGYLFVDYSKIDVEFKELH